MLAARILVCVVLVATLLPDGCAASFCPPEQALEPFCYCMRVSVDALVSCRNLTAPEEIMRAMLPLEGKFMFALAIYNSNLMYLPQNAFTGIHFERISIFDSQLMALTDSDRALEGLENSLTDLRITRVEFAAMWKWKHLSHLQNLRLLDVSQVDLYSIDEPLPKLPKLKALAFVKARLTFLADGAFAQLNKIQILDLSHNMIHEMKRNMLPRPANELRDLTLDDNHLRTLPEDMFDEMPNLQNLQLRHNFFGVIEKKIFSKIFDLLESLTFRGNPLRCDCRMRWLRDHYFPTESVAVCAAPIELKGKQLKDIPQSDLIC